MTPRRRNRVDDTFDHPGSSITIPSFTSLVDVVKNSVSYFYVIPDRLIFLCAEVLWIW